MGDAPILLVHESPESFRTTLSPLGRLIYERSGIRSIVIGPPGDRPEATFITADSGRFAKGDQRPDRPQVKAGRSHLFSVSRASRFVADLRYWNKEAERILDTYRPRAVFTVKRDVEDSPLLNRRAQRRGIPVIGMQWSFLPPDSYEKYRFRATYISTIQHLPLPVRELRFLRARSERWMQSLYYRLHGIRWKDSYINMADAQAIGVTNSLYADVFMRQGVPTSKIHVTGHPEDDVLFRYKVRYGDPSERAAARREFGLNETTPIFIVGREFMTAVSGLLDPETDKDVLVSVLQTLTRRRGAQVVLKLHPKDKPGEFNWVHERFPKVTVIHRCDLYKLTAVSDLLLTQGSSVTRWAVVLGVPAALIDFAGLEFPALAERMFRLQRLANVTDLESLIAKVESGQFHYDENHIRPVVETVDGKASERIIALAGMPELLNRKREPGVAVRTEVVPEI